MCQSDIFQPSFLSVCFGFLAILNICVFANLMSESSEHPCFCQSDVFRKVSSNESERDAGGSAALLGVRIREI